MCLVYFQVMRSLALVMGALYSAIRIYNSCSEWTVNIQYTRNAFHFQWDWESNSFSVAEKRIMESKKFSPLPEEVREWPNWWRRIRLESAEIQSQVKNGKEWENFSLYSVYCLGMNWKRNVELWPKPKWDQLVIDDVLVNSVYSTDDEDYMRNEFKKKVFKSQDFHLGVQKQFLGLLRTAIQANPRVHRRMDEFYRELSRIDFLQG